MTRGHPEQQWIMRRLDRITGMQDGRTQHPTATRTAI